MMNLNFIITRIRRKSEIGHSPNRDHCNAYGSKLTNFLFPPRWTINWGANCTSFFRNVGKNLLYFAWYVRIIVRAYAVRAHFVTLELFGCLYNVTDLTIPNWRIVIVLCNAFFFYFLCTYRTAATPFYKANYRPLTCNLCVVSFHALRYITMSWNKFFPELSEDECCRLDSNCL